MTSLAHDVISLHSRSWRHSIFNFFQKYKRSSAHFGIFSSALIQNFYFVASTTKSSCWYFKFLFLTLHWQLQRNQRKILLYAESLPQKCGFLFCIEAWEFFSVLCQETAWWELLSSKPVAVLAKQKRTFSGSALYENALKCTYGELSILWGCRVLLGLLLFSVAIGSERVRFSSRLSVKSSF